MLNSRQKLAEQLLMEPEVPKAVEQTTDKKAPPKFKRPALNKGDNESNAEKKPKANLDDLLDNYEKQQQQLPEVDLNMNKISIQDVAEEAHMAHKAALLDANEVNSNEAFEANSAGTTEAREEQGSAFLLGNEQQRSEFCVKSDNNAEEDSEAVNSNFNYKYKDNKNNFGKVLNRQNEELKAVEEESQNKAEDKTDNLIKIYRGCINERINSVMNNEDTEEQHNTKSHLMNLNHSENTFDEINLNSNCKNNKSNSDKKKFKEIGSTTSINPKKTCMFEEDIGSSNNLFESTTSHTKNFFENLSAANYQNNNIKNNINNNNFSLNSSAAVINLGSEKSLGGENQSIKNTRSNNSDKELIGGYPKHTDNNSDFNVNPSNSHENKSTSNTHSENNHNSHGSQGDDNLSIPEINCKSIELTNENFITEKKQHSINSSNMNLNNERNNGKFQETKEFNCEANNFFSNFKDENSIISNSTNIKHLQNNNILKAKVSDFGENANEHDKNQKAKNKIFSISKEPVEDFSENLNLNENENLNEKEEQEIIRNGDDEKNENKPNFSTYNFSNSGHRSNYKYLNQGLEAESTGSNTEHGLLSSSEKNRIQILEDEINNLRKIIGECKRKEIEENESMLKLEIVSLNNTIKAKSCENDLLLIENKNLKTHVHMLQETIETYFAQNSNKNKFKTADDNNIEFSNNEKIEEKVLDKIEENLCIDFNKEQTNG